MMKRILILLALTLSLAGAARPVVQAAARPTAVPTSMPAAQPTAMPAAKFAVQPAAMPPTIPAPGAHPRLLLRAGEEEAVRERIASEREVARADSIIMGFCERVLDAPPVDRTMIGRRLLHTSREALKRIFYLSYAYRIHGGEAYADRAVREMMAVCRFSDWNPKHFLDVGEMTMAVAIGYDWMYDRLSPARRDSVAAAVRELAFEPSHNPKRAWFYTRENNWNQVCNAGLSYGAIALFEHDPDEAREILRKCLETNPKSLRAYSPEGGYPEGYNYWGYGTSFQVMLLAALESAYGTDFGLLDDAGAGFLRTGEFLRMMSTPTGHCYNFYDSGRWASFQYMQAYFGRISGDPSLLGTELDIFRSQNGDKRICEDRLFPFFPVAMARYPVALKDLPEPEGHTYVCGGITPVFIYRSGWHSPDDTYLGIKGGLSMSSHAHNDQGSFYYEDEGVVWATDLGMQEYESLESKKLDIWKMHGESDRWRVFRIGPYSHNILTINGHNPKVNHSASLDETWTEAAETKDAATKGATAIKGATRPNGIAVTKGATRANGRAVTTNAARIKGETQTNCMAVTTNAARNKGVDRGSARPGKGGRRIGAGLNLTAIYSEDLDSCYRRVFLERGDLIIEDYITARDTACTVRWALCSETEASVDGDRIILSRNGKSRTVTMTALRPLLRLPSRYAKPPRRDPVPISAHIWAASWSATRAAASPIASPTISPVTSPTASSSASSGVSSLAPTWAASDEPPCCTWPNSPLHSYDARNPGVSLSGFLIEITPRETVLLRVRISSSPSSSIRSAAP